MEIDCATQRIVARIFVSWMYYFKKSEKKGPAREAFSWTQLMKDFTVPYTIRATDKNLV